MSKWHENIAAGLASARPVSGPVVGALYFSTDTNALERWSGSAWEVFVVPGLALEALQDAVGAMIAAGTGITAVYDDGTGTLTISTTITQYTDEMVRDVIGAALVEGANIDLTVNDAGDTITIAVTGAVLESLATTAGDILVRNATILQRLGVGANGEVLTVDTSLAHKLKWAALGAASFFPWPMIVGRLYDTQYAFGGEPATGAHTAKVLYGIPFIVPVTTTFDLIAVHVNTLGSGNQARIGIYNESNGVGGSLVLDAGLVSLASTGFKSIAISQQLPAGRYILAFYPELSTGAVASLNADSNESIISFGLTDGSIPSAVATTAPIGIVSTALLGDPFGALPNPFGTAGIPGAQRMPRVALRVASIP